MIKGQPLALMRPPATGEGRQLLVRNRTSQDIYGARFLLMDNFRNQKPQDCPEPDALRAKERRVVAFGAVIPVPSGKPR